MEQRLFFKGLGHVFVPDAYLKLRGRGVEGDDGESSMII
jgi:hypothetical protein